MRTLAFAILVVTCGCSSAPPPQSDGRGVVALEAPPSPSVPHAASFAAQPEGKRVVVLYTASVQGYVEPCGCTAEPLGGVARLAAAVAEARAAYGERVLFVDAGDLLFEHPDDTAAADACQAEARADVLVSTYARAGLVGTVLGPLDDVRGASFRDARLARHGVLSLGVNPPRALVDGAVATPGVVRVLADAKGAPTKIGVTAFRVDVPADIEAAHAALAAEVARERAEGADAVVVLAQAPRAITRKVVVDVDGIDVVIQGRAPGEVPVAPERLTSSTGVPGPIIVASGQQAQQLGVLELVLDGRDQVAASGASTPRAALELDDRAGRRERHMKVLAVRIDELTKQVRATPDGARKQFLAERLATAESERVAAASVDVSAPLLVPHVVARNLPLPRGFPEEATARAALASYTASIPALVSTCEASLTCPAPAPGAQTYVGAATCKTCHAKAFAFWSQQTVQIPAKDHDGRPIVRTSGHARAWQTLVDDNKTADRSCVGCHSVGFSEPGGACKTTDIVKRGLEGVQCESCHGPGSDHVALADKKHTITLAPDEATCRSCHHVPHIPTTESFVFTDRLKLVIGPGHGAR